MMMLSIILVYLICLLFNCINGFNIHSFNNDNNLSKIVKKMQLKSIENINKYEIFKSIDYSMNSRNNINTNNLKPIESPMESSNMMILYPIGLSISCIMLFPLESNAATDLNPIFIAKPFIDNFINILSLLFLFRTILSWYPKTDLNKFPYNIIVWPTEALAQPVRSIIPPAFGVDISSLVWIMFLSFFREVFTGQQGIITLMEKSADI